MTPLFKTSELQEEFNKNGFVHLPLLTAEQADQLLQFYKTLEVEHQQIGLPFITTSHSNNDELIRKADQYIERVLAPEMDKFLHNYKLLFGNFLIKQPGPDSITPLHQDTTFVDETKFSSISIWVSLQDTGPGNGCMRFVKGSHKFKIILRPTQTYPWPFEGVRNRLEKLLVDYPSRKGEAFIFHHGLIHASYANLTDTPRIAAVMAAYPAEAELLLLFLTKESSTNVQKYKMTKEAYLHFVKGEPPSMGELLEIAYFDFKQITPVELDGMITPSKSFAQKLRGHLSIFRRNKNLQ